MLKMMKTKGETKRSKRVEFMPESLFWISLVFLWVCLVKWPVGLVLEGATAAALQELWAAS